MKKSLFLTSALVAASVLALGVTNDALAASKAKKISIGVSGSYRAMIGYSSQANKFENRLPGTESPSYANRDIKTDSEIHFKGSTKTSNGLNVGVHIELEADQADGNIIDQSFMTVGGGFGTVAIGSSAAASAILYRGTPQTGVISHTGPDSSEWVVRPAASKVPAGAGNNIGGGDAMKVRYVSLPFSGFTLGGSWVPSNTNSDAAVVDGGNAPETQQTDVILSYAGKMGASAINASASFWTVSAGTASTENFTLSANTTLGAWGLGAGYLESRATGSDGENISMSTSGGDASLDAKSYNYGVTWNQGNITLSGTYFKYEMPLSLTVSGGDSVTKYTLGAKYAMSPGVDLLGTVQDVQWKDELVTAGNSNKGVAIIGGIHVAF